MPIMKTLLMFYIWSAPGALHRSISQTAMYHIVQEIF